MGRRVAAGTGWPGESLAGVAPSSASTWVGSSLLAPSGPVWEASADLRVA